MGWYAVHVLIVTRYQDGPQDSYPTWENVVMVEAASFEEAGRLAEDFARDNYTEDAESDYCCDGRPATLEFAGIRKIMEVLMLDEEGRPGHGSAITAWKLEVQTEIELQKLLSGTPVTVLLA